MSEFQSSPSDYETVRESATDWHSTRSTATDDLEEEFAAMIRF